MMYSPSNPALLYTLLGWIGGVASTVAGSWISSKIRDYHDSRKAHFEDLKEKVLVPIRNGLATHFAAAISHQVPLLAQQRAPVEIDERAKVTEEPVEEGDVLVAPLPTSKIFGPIPSALLEDARKNHFPKVLARVDGFLLCEWSTYLGLWHSWATRISAEILKQSGLEAYSAESSDMRRYVMHRDLALFLYKRLADFATPRLTIEGQSPVWALTGMNTILAFGTREQIEALVGLLDKLLETERPRIAELRGKAAAFQEEFGKICAELDYVIASRRPRGGCDLVTFF